MPRGIYIRTKKHKQALKVPRKGAGIYERISEMKTGEHSHRKTDTFGWNTMNKVKKVENNKY